jgi:hypothetical protein
MSNQKLGILAVVAAVMVVWATVQSRNAGTKTAEPTGPAYLIQGLDPVGIGSIVVGQGDKAIKIQRSGNQFLVVNEVNYPADTKQINDLISKSLDIKTAGVYTDQAENHEELEVTEAKARNVIKFFKPDGSLLTGIIIGKSQENGQATYVRRVSDDAVYLADSVPWFRDRALDYVNQELTTVKRADVNTVTVTAPEGSYTLRPQGSDGVALADLPAGKKLKDSDAKSVLTALSSLRFDDVNAPSQVDGLTFDRDYTCRLNDSTEYRLHLAKKGDKTYVKCDAMYTDPTKVTINPNAKDSPEELKEKEAKLQAQANAQKFTLCHKGWVYQIPDWKAKYLMMGRTALLEDVKPAVATTPEPNQPSATPVTETQNPASSPVETLKPAQPGPNQPQEQSATQPPAAQPAQPPAAQPAVATTDANQPK